MSTSILVATTQAPSWAFQRLLFDVNDIFWSKGNVIFEFKIRDRVKKWKDF